MISLTYYLPIMIKLKLFLLIFLHFSLRGETGVNKNSIVFGQSAALSGEAQYLGVNMRLGILAAFQEINKRGGVYGRKLKLISLNDSYEPELAIKNTRALIKKHKVFSLIGGVGTPPSKAMMPIISETSIPYIGPFTGAEFLRDSKKNKYVINVRASYYQEISYIVDKLINDLGLERISILYQDDSFGRVGLEGLQKALKDKNKSIASKGTYLRNTKAVKIALLEILSGNPQAVIIAGAYGPSAEFINLAESIKFKPIFIALSFVGTSALWNQLKKETSPVIITQVVPYPFNTDLILVKNYRKAIQKNFNFVSLEGYLVGRLTGLILEKIGQYPTRNKFLKYIRQNKDIMIDDFSLRYGENDNQGSDRIFLSYIFNKKLLPMNSLKELSLQETGSSQKE